MLKHPALACFAIWMGGCALSPPGSVDVEAYAERVFRLHNQVSSDFMLLLPELEFAEPDRYARLSDLEMEMLDACAPLDRIATRESAGKSSGIGKHLEAKAALKRCDEATHRALRSMDE